MQNPGSNPDIPVEARIEFEEQWDRTRPGAKRKIAYLELENERRLVVFPHREWNAPVGHTRQVVLFPVRNAAVAAPVGGIPDSERIAPSLPTAPVVGSPPAAGGRDGYDHMVGLLESIDRAYSRIDEGMEALNEALDQLTEMVRQVRPSADSADSQR